MIQIDEKYLITVKNILQKYVPNAVVKVFGSRVNGNPKPHSDLDIALDIKKEIDLLTLAKIEQEFEDSNLPFRVDIMDWNCISKEIKELIEEKHERI